MFSFLLAYTFLEKSLNNVINKSPVAIRFRDFILNIVDIIENINPVAKV